MAGFADSTSADWFGDPARRSDVVEALPWLRAFVQRVIRAQRLGWDHEVSLAGLGVSHIMEMLDFQDATWHQLLDDPIEPHQG